jgi:hydroxymethylpyrimidine/phosphomethylpyrimidine kinase
MIDRLQHGDALHEFEHERLDVEGHGTGCTLASAIAANLAMGLSLADACGEAADYVHGALQARLSPRSRHGRRTRPLLAPALRRD